MSFKIVMDSSSNIKEMSGIEYAVVPLKIYLGEREYVDDATLDINAMLKDFSQSKERSSTSCPNVYDWLEAFKGADEIFAVTISGNLSGTYQSAVSAKKEYLDENPNAKICVIDSLSTGPEMRLIAEKIKELHECGKSFFEIENEIEEYRQKTHLFFCLKSMRNLVRNGRINSTAAKIAGVLDIEILGRASNEGELELLHKCRGKIKTINKIAEEMEKHNFSGGRVIISHCNNIEDASILAEKIKESFQGAEVMIEECGGLCSYYAEEGGMIIGFLSSQKEVDGNLKG